MIKIENPNLIDSDIISIDIGISGGITCNDGFNTYSILMPTYKVETKPAILVLDLDSNGKKQYYKSGSSKDQVKMKTKTKAKYRNELDVIAIRDIFDIPNANKVTIVLEEPGKSVGNAAKSTASTHRNYGKLLAIAELSGANVVTVPANKWKKDLGLTSDKLECVKHAELLSGSKFRSHRDSLLDGQAESFLIGYWYSKFRTI